MRVASCRDHMRSDNRLYISVITMVEGKSSSLPVKTSRRHQEETTELLFSQQHLPDDEEYLNLHQFQRALSSPLSSLLPVRLSPLAIMDIARLLRAWVVPGIMFTILYSISVFYGVLFLLRFLYRWVRNPSERFWRVSKREVPPACLNDPSLGNHAYVQLKHVKLHYVENGDKSKPLMLFLHGFPEFWYSWRHQLKEFSKDYWVVAVDMRGYGDSEKPEGIRFYRLKYLVEDVKNLIEALGREQCTLVAHDWGGMVAWYFLMIYPKWVDTYIIMNAPHPVVFRKMMIKRFSQFRKSWYIFFFQLPYLPEMYMRIKDMSKINKLFTSKKSPSPYTAEDIEAYKFTFGKPGLGELGAC
ncbi:Epoxide hydrolase 4 [Homalodisca vitripennis]|nr:Epoxide hydrolase 4 [Homalodisca vitripennis]